MKTDCIDSRIRCNYISLLNSQINKCNLKIRDCFSPVNLKKKTHPRSMFEFSVET